MRRGILHAMRRWLDASRLRRREPTRGGPRKPARGDEGVDRRARDGPAEPGAHLVLVRDDGGADAEQDELVERDILRRLPRLAPHLVPAREHARVAMAALAVLDRDPAREDRAGLLEPLAHLPQHRGVEAELALQILDGARTGGLQMTQQAREIVICPL